MTRTVPGLLDWENLDDFFVEGELAVKLCLPTGVTFLVIYMAESADEGDLDGPWCWAKQIDVNENSITHGMTVTIDEVDYTVAGIRPDGTGMCELRLRP